jgi:hypothetical protein
MPAGSGTAAGTSCLPQNRRDGIRDSGAEFRVPSFRSPDLGSRIPTDHTTASSNSLTMASAAARGSGAAMIGLPTTR